MIGLIQSSSLLSISRSYQKLACLSPCPTFFPATFNPPRRRHITDSFPAPRLHKPPLLYFIVTLSIMNPLWSESTQILQVWMQTISTWAEPDPYKRQRPPNILTPEDIARIPTNNDIESNVRFLEAMNTRYGNHPYITAQLAIRMDALGSIAMSARLLYQAPTHPLSQTPSDDRPRPRNP